MSPVESSALRRTIAGMLQVSEGHEQLSELFEGQLFGTGSGWQSRPQKCFFSSFTGISPRKVIN
jgi:hypothetical protein